MTVAEKTPSHRETPSTKSGDAAMKPHRFLAHHFESSQQQFDSGKLGMWLFLLTEVLFFSGLFCAYAVFRNLHPEVFSTAAQFLDSRLGAINTVILIFSSMTMAWSVRCAQLNQSRGLIVCLAVTLLCAGLFLGIKTVEYHHKWHDGLLWAGSIEPTAETLTVIEANGIETQEVGIFFSIYFLMTGIHAIHIVGGIGAIIWLLIRSIKGHFSSDYFGPVDYVGLYWHLVDLVWIYLFPLLYLIG